MISTETAIKLLPLGGYLVFLVMMDRRVGRLERLMVQIAKQLAVARGNRREVRAYVDRVVARAVRRALREALTLQPGAKRLAR